MSSYVNFPQQNYAFSSNQVGRDSNNYGNYSQNEISVFDSYQTSSTSEIGQLKEEFENVKKEQGIIGKAWDGVKSFFGVGSTSDKVEQTIEKAENGEISVQEAQEEIQKYEGKQKTMTSTFSNIISGLATFGAIMLAPVTGGASLLVGAGVGAASKVAVTGLDKATNEIEGDYSAKDIAKDAVSGAVNGVVTVATAGVGSGTGVAATTLRGAVKQGVISGAKAGAVDGSAMNAADYVIDCAFGDQKFKVETLASNAVTGAVAGGITGGVVGGITSGVTFRKAQAAPSNAKNEAPSNAKNEAPSSANSNADSSITLRDIDGNSVNAEFVKTGKNGYEIQVNGKKTSDMSGSIHSGESTMSFFSDGLSENYIASVDGIEVKLNDNFHISTLETLDGTVKGGGTSLLKKAAEESVEKGCQGRVTLDAAGKKSLMGSPDSKPFYYKNGFKFFESKYNAAMEKWVADGANLNNFHEYLPSAPLPMYLTEEGLDKLLKG